MGSEERIQMMVVQWFRTQYRDAFLTISPNVKVSIGVAMKLKRMGYLAGTPDLLILHPVGDFCGCLIELKTDEGKPSSKQMAILSHLRDVGYFSAVCYGFDDAVETITTYMENKYEFIDESKKRKERLNDNTSESLLVAQQAE